MGKLYPADRKALKHDWIPRMGLRSCRACGVVKNPNGNDPCPGKIRPELRDNRMAEFVPCPTCGQYSHSIPDDRVADAFNHFQSMIAHPVRGHPMSYAFHDKTRNAAQVLTAAIRATPAVDREGVGFAKKIAEVMAEGDGHWSPCTGCQESVEGHVSTEDYPYEETFKCQPGGGCGECGGIGATWTPAGFYDGIIEFSQEQDRTHANVLAELKKLVAINGQIFGLSAAADAILALNPVKQSLTTEVADGWQDISTAPMDGCILISRPTQFPEEEAHVVYWDDDWWQVHDGKTDHPLRGPDPTHWRPLPAPPTGLVEP